MWNSLPKSVRLTETLAAFQKQIKKLTYFVYTTCLDDTDFYFMTLLGFKLFCLKLYFTPYFIYCFIIIYLSLFIFIFTYLFILAYLLIYLSFFILSYLMYLINLYF